MSAEVQLGWDNAKLQAGARQAGDIVDAQSSRMRKALGGIGSGIGAGVGFGVFSAATSIISQTAGAIYDATLTADSLQGGMEALTGSVSAANQRLDEMRLLAKDPGLGFAQVVQGDIALQSVGLSAQMSTRAMKEFGNALAVVGKGKADLDGVLLAITQIVSKGKVSAEEINQIAERVPQIRKVMQDAFGTADTEAIQKMGIPVERFIELVVNGFERTVPRATVRLQGRIDNFTDALTARMADVGAGIAEGLLGPMDESTMTLENSAEAAIAFGQEFGGNILAAIAVAGQFKDALDFVGQSLQDATIFTLDLIPALKEKRMAIIESNNEMIRMKDAELAAARVAADLARHQRELETATKRVAEAQAEATRRANERAAAEAKLTAEVIKSTNAARDAYLTERGRTEDMYLTDQEKLEKVKQRILDIDRQINATSGQVGGAEITYKLQAEREKSMQELLRLSQAIAAEQAKTNTTDTKAVDAAARKVADQEQALRLFELELGIAEAISRGQDKKAEKLQRERDIIEQTARLMDELSLGYDEAAKKAEQLVNAEAKAAGRQSGTDAGGRSTIQGYSQNQGDATEARKRAQTAVDDSRAAYEDSVRRNFGTFSEVDAAQKEKFGSLFGNAPAEQSAPKTGGDGLTAVADRLDAWAQTTTELFEKALA